jgi:uncharacterized membrane protein YcaP (DUF421 family)
MNSSDSFFARTFFDSWPVLGRTVIVACVAYVVLVLFLRISGKRTLSKWNAFDFIVTIALGSTLASILTSKNVALAQGALALGLLVGFQFLITWLAVRLKWVRELIKAEPTLLLRDGQILHDALRKQRVTESEIRAAVRAKGIGALEDVRAVVLETDGQFSVVRNIETDRCSALADVPGIGPPEMERERR